MADKQKTILVVDDEEAILESLAFTLDDEYRVFTATTGAEGLELLEALLRDAARASARYDGEIRRHSIRAATRPQIRHCDRQRR